MSEFHYDTTLGLIYREVLFIYHCVVLCNIIMRVFKCQIKME